MQTHRCAPSTANHKGQTPVPTIYEKRTYSVTVGQMSEVIRLYSTQGSQHWKLGDLEELDWVLHVRYRQLHLLIHLWRFDSDEDRRSFWKRLFEDADFMAFAKQLRPLIKTQSNQLLLPLPGVRIRSSARRTRNQIAAFGLGLTRVSYGSKTGCAEFIWNKFKLLDV